MKYVLLAMAVCIAVSVALTHFIDNGGKLVAMQDDEYFEFFRR